jgi:hypothetical protein
MIVALHPEASIPVIVSHAGGQNQTRVAMGPPNPGVSATLVPDDPFNQQQYGMQPHGEAEGFAFMNVPEGKYRLEVQSFGNECVESAWYGNVDLLRDYLVVSGGGEMQPITINLTSDCATLSAKVAPGEDQRQGFVLVVPSSSFAGPKILPIVAPGFVTAGFRGPALALSPGTYQVYAFSSLDGLEYANPETLREYPSQSVSLEAAQKLELAVKISDVTKGK